MTTFFISSPCNSVRAGPSLGCKCAMGWSRAKKNSSKLKWQIKLDRLLALMSAEWYSNFSFRAENIRTRSHGPVCARHSYWIPLKTVTKYTPMFINLGIFNYIFFSILTIDSVVCEKLLINYYGHPY